MHHDLEVRGHIFKNLARIIVDLAQPLRPAGRTGADTGMGNDLAWQMSGQRFAITLSGFPGWSWHHRRCRPRLTFRLALFEVTDNQFELFDLTVKLFRRLAKAGTTQSGELDLELFNVEGFGIKLALQQRCKSP
jgi:hypothetical protein